tara:strand:- start:2983 stop:3102 length:120 start_codon:yes stop_codon:yes gene_type:complete
VVAKSASSTEIAHQSWLSVVVADTVAKTIVALVGWLNLS